MENRFLEAILTRLKIGGHIAPSDHVMILKYLLTRVTELEEKMDEATVSKSRSSKVPKKKTTTP